MRKNLLALSGILCLFVSGCSIIGGKPLAGERKSLNQFQSSFRSSVIKTCISNKNNDGARDKIKYCTCYANSYIDRYNTKDLADLNKLAGMKDSKNTAGLIGVLMRPETRVCLEKFATIK